MTGRKATPEERAAEDYEWANRRAAMVWTQPESVLAMTGILVQALGHHRAMDATQKIIDDQRAAMDKALEDL